MNFPIKLVKLNDLSVIRHLLDVHAKSAVVLSPFSLLVLHFLARFNKDCYAKLHAFSLTVKPTDFIKDGSTVQLYFDFIFK